MKRSIVYVATYLLLVCLQFGVLFGQDAPKKKNKKPQAPGLEDAVARAIVKAKKIDSDRLVRLTVAPAETLDDYGFLVLCEFGTGDMAVFQGGEDAEEDAWIFIAKRQLTLLDECAKRSKEH